MKKRRTNIKIKRSKHNLYHKANNSGKKVLSAVITVVITAALGVVGFGIGKAIMEHKDDIPSEPESVWSPPESVTSSEAEESMEASSSQPEESKPEANKPAQGLSGMYILPASAAESSEKLGSAIAAAKARGCTGIIVTLKDDEGNFYYKTGIEGFKDTEHIVGSLTAAQIFGMIKSQGLNSAAKISTLKDGKSHRIIGGQYLTGGVTWNDGNPAAGGKPWMDPFNDITTDFIESVAEEISAAGFTNIMISDTRFPAFANADYDSYLSDQPHLKDAKQRLKALWNVVDAAKAGAAKNGAEISLEVDGAALLSGNTSGTTAELCASKSKLADISIMVSYSAEGDGAGSYGNARAAAMEFAKAFGSKNYSVRISGSFSDAVLSEIKKAFTDDGAVTVDG